MGMLLLLGVVTATTAPPPNPVARYERMRDEGNAVCFSRLASGSADNGMNITAAHIDAAQLCNCVGNMFATEFISLPFNESYLKGIADRTDEQRGAMFAKYVDRCMSH